MTQKLSSRQGGRDELPQRRLPMKQPAALIMLSLSQNVLTSKHFSAKMYYRTIKQFIAIIPPRPKRDPSIPLPSRA
jgi:hypothetical protein